MAHFFAILTNKTKPFVVGLVTGLIISGSIASLALLFHNLSDTGKATASSDISSPHPILAKSTIESGEIEGNTREKASTSLMKFARLTSRSARSLALQSMLEDLDQETLSALLADSSEIAERGFRTEFEATIVRKMATINPEYVLDRIEDYPTVRFHELVSLVFEEWSRSSLDAATEYAQGMSFTTREVVLNAILNASDDFTTNDLLSAARKLGMEQMALERIEEKLNEQPILDPKESWNSFVSIHHNEFRSLNRSGRELLGNIAQALVDKLGEDAFDFADQSLDNYYDRKRALGPIVSRISRTNPKRAFELARSLGPSRDDHTTIWTVAREWTASEPKAAFESVMDVDQGWLRRQLLFEVINQWVSLDPADLLEHLNTFPIEWQTHGERQAWNSIAANNPEHASKMLDTIQNESVKLSVAETIAERWAASDVEAALAWINSDIGKPDVQSRLAAVVLRNFARLDSQKALELALSQSASDSGVGPEAEVLNTIATRDVETSIDLLSKSRNDRTKLAGMISIGSTLLRYYRNPDRAMELAEQAPSEEARDEYFRSLLPYWTSAIPETLYERISQFPTKELQSLVAVYLIRHDKGNFLVKDLEVLRSHLTDEMRANLDL